MRVGNFSAIPRRRLSSLVVVAEMWNHYAAAVFRSRSAALHDSDPRGKRLHGQSSMNFVSLVAHGLSAISVYSDVVGVRLLVMSVLMAVFTLGGIVAAVIVRLATNWAVPGWASYTVGILLILLVQAVMAAFVFSFVILGSRHGRLSCRGGTIRFSSAPSGPFTVRAVVGAVAGSGRFERSHHLVGELSDVLHLRRCRARPLCGRGATGNRTSAARSSVTWAPRCSRSAREGGTTQRLCRAIERWVCLEPDAALADSFRPRSRRIAGLLPDADRHAG